MISCSSDSPTFSVLIAGSADCDSSVFGETTDNDRNHYYIFQNKIANNVISIDTLEYLETGATETGVKMRNALLYIRHGNGTVIKTATEYLLLTSLPMGTYLIQISVTSTATPGKYNMKMECTLSESPTSSPTNSPSIATMNPTVYPSNQPSNPTISSPTTTPTS